MGEYGVSEYGVGTYGEETTSTPITTSSVLDGRIRQSIFSDSVITSTYYSKIEDIEDYLLKSVHPKIKIEVGDGVTMAPIYNTLDHTTGSLNWRWSYDGSNL